MHIPEEIISSQSIHIAQGEVLLRQGQKCTNYLFVCEGKIKSLPWCEIPLAIESGQISKELVKLNESGFLTINSQPKVNGVPSEDPDVGWGAPGG